MSKLSAAGAKILDEIAVRHGVSQNAVEHLLLAVISGGGTQAQFNHQDIGGMGQWSQGGMTMVGDMFNNGLKATVDSLCTELATLARGSEAFQQPSGQSQSQSQGGSMGGMGSNMGGGMGGGVSLFVPGTFRSATWWPEELGQPASTGAQNNLRYAFFPGARRLAIDIAGHITVYDTQDHQIGGFSQQQSGDQSISFTSQYGLVRVAELKVVSPEAQQTEAPIASDAPAPADMQPDAPFDGGANAPLSVPMPAAASQAKAPFPAASPPPTAQAQPVSADDIFDKIERLAGLHAKGILTDQEFETKKAELLARL